MSTLSSVIQGCQTPARLAPRVNTDPYYAELFRRTGDLELLARAGFFDDGLSPPLRERSLFKDVSVLTTPVSKVSRRLQSSPDTRPPLVLLSTGSFSPVHQGHLDMMEQARKAAEGAGFSVVGGYFSPSHDSYVSWKQGGAAARHAEERISLLETAVSDSPWLAVDSWESRYLPLAVNFTDVLDRLQAYLQRHVSPRITVAYVFGSDNYAFAHTFCAQGLGICVARKPLTEEQQALVKASGRVLYADTPGHYATYSSTAVRAGDLTMVPEKARHRLARYQQASTEDGAYYVLRDDIPYATQDWNTGELAGSAFLHRLVSILQNELPPHVRVLTVNGKEQVALAHSALAGQPAVSMDVLFKGAGALNIGRLFEVSGGQVFSKTMVPRPGYPDLATQLKGIPPDIRMLVDDDIATGTTFAGAARILGKDPADLEGLFLHRLSLETQGLAGAAVYDVVDARDFLMGSKDAGLIVELPDGAVCRAPYMLPFVSLIFRARIPEKAHVRLSHAIWMLNSEWFRQFAPHLTVAEAAKTQQGLLLAQGFSLSTPLSDVAKHFANYLLQTQWM